MDTSPEYIKMCLELPPDFLPDMEYEEGDYCIFAKTKTMPWDHVGILGTRGFTDHPSVWLPRLDQLLEMTKPLFNDEFGIFLLQNFKEYTDHESSRSHDWGLKFPTLEQMALCFVMSEIHGMEWNGETWEAKLTAREAELQRIFEEEDGQ